MFSFKIQMFQCKQCEFHFFKFQNIFHHGVSSDGEGFSQLYLELADAYKKYLCTSRRIKVPSNMEENKNEF